MATPFLGSEEYDERAHRLYNEGEYDRALEVLKEGLVLYPHSVDLHVGLGYTRLAREEFAWAKQSFDTALALDPEHEDALVGLGEVLLRLGRRREALELFDRVRRSGSADDLDLLLSMGRALYRDRSYEEARDLFTDATVLHPESAEAAAALAYTLHRLGRLGAARRELRRALKIDPRLYEARIYLGHLLYDRGDWEGALRHFEEVPASEHWDTLALWRLLELKRTFEGRGVGQPELAVWESRLEQLETDYDPIDDLLAEIEQRFQDSHGGGRGDGRADAALGASERAHRVRLPDGRVYAGSWLDIVRQLRDAVGRPEETVAQFMRRHADEQSARTGVGIPADDPETFLRASARAGLLSIEH